MIKVNCSLQNQLNSNINNDCDFPICFKYTSTNKQTIKQTEKPKRNKQTHISVPVSQLTPVNPG